MEAEYSLGWVGMAVVGALALALACGVAFLISFAGKRRDEE